MDKAKFYFVQILKSFVQEQSFDDPDMTTDDWLAVYRLGSIHSDNGIISYMIKTNPSAANQPLSGNARMNLMSTISVYASRAELMKLLMEKMNAAGIEHLLFKGFIVRDLYPVPELRSFGDIDFLIHLEDRQRMNDLMLSDGYELHDDWEPVYSYLKGQEFYEIHSHVMEVDVSDKADYKGYYSHIWEHAHPVDDDPQHRYTYVLDMEYHLLYLLTHIAKHISSSGAGIRMYIDIAFYLKRYRDEIDWEHFQQEVHTLAFEDFVNMVFSAVEQWFGVNSPISLQPVDPEVMGDFLEFTLDGGVFGGFNKSSGETWLKREDRNDTEEVSKAKTMLHRIFPPASNIESRYTYLQGHHWLLPVAWVHRLIKTRSKFSQHAEEAKDIMNADDEKIRKMKRMYKAIGL